MMIELFVLVGNPVPQEFEASAPDILDISFSAMSDCLVDLAIVYESVPSFGSPLFCPSLSLCISWHTHKLTPATAQVQSSSKLLEPSCIHTVVMMWEGFHGGMAMTWDFQCIADKWPLNLRLLFETPCCKRTWSGRSEFQACMDLVAEKLNLIQLWKIRRFADIKAANTLDYLFVSDRP